MSLPSDAADLSLAEAARRLRGRELSPVELTRACLARIERLDPALRAFVAVDPEGALARARAVEGEMARAGWRGPLHGIPVGLKDLVDVAGAPTTAASAAYSDRIARRDAHVVERLRAAGAVLLGKLNLHELAYGASSVVGHYGVVRNPWAAGRTAGGSSSGAAVAVACGMCFAAIGTDTGGSIRQPAAFCGIVGLKPTFGRVSVRGVMALAPSYDHVGPMTRTAEDAALVLAAIAGHDPEDPTTLRSAVPDYVGGLEAERGVRGVRVGIPRAHFFEALDPDIGDAVARALDVLRSLGAQPRDVDVPASTDTTLFRAEAWAQHAARARAAPELFQPETLRRLQAGAEVDPADAAEARRRLAELRARAGELFVDVDVVVTPTTAVPPFAVAEPPPETADLRGLELATLRNTRPFNALGLPAASVPCGFTREELPVGLQVAGAPGAEAAVLRLAHAYERARGPHVRLPPAVLEAG